MPEEWMLPFEGEAIAATLAFTSATRGDAASVMALSVSKPTFEVIRVDFGGSEIGIALHLELPALQYALLSEVREQIQSNLSELLDPIIRTHPGYWLGSVSLIPDGAAPSDWRERARAFVAGDGVSNQGRVRSDNIAARECDGLLFRSQPEINLYRAFKALGVSFAPLPVFVRGGQNEYRRIEPDFVIIIKGMIAVVEVDGSTVHRELPAEAQIRTKMLSDEGAYIDHVLATDCETPEKALSCAKRVLASIDKVRNSRR